MHERRAFTLIELTISLVIMVTVAALALPYFAADHSDRASAIASLVCSDLRYAQVACMADTQDPVVVRFKADGRGYWLARLSTPDVAITRPDTGAPWDVTMGVDRARPGRYVTITTANIAGGILRFSPVGSVLDANGSPLITLTAAGPGGTARSCVVTVDPLTGATSTSFP